MNLVPFIQFRFNDERRRRRSSNKKKRTFEKTENELNDAQIKDEKSRKSDCVSKFESKKMRK